MTFRGALTITILAASGLACQIAVGDDCDHTAPREATLAASGATRVVIDAGAGSLDVRGVPGGELHARGTACASREAVLNEIRLVADRRGDTLHIETRFPRNFHGSARLDLEVEVPADLEVAIDDGSGSIDVRGVAALTIHDGSGGIHVADVAGALDIEDGSGVIELLGIGGDVTVDDGSGGIDIRGAGGRVRINDGSGEITVRDVDGDVILEDGSGSMEIAGVGGSVVVEEDGSGGIRVEDVRGDLRIKDDGSGGVDYARIDGRVSIDND
jgi:hypothetical protein